MPAYLSVQLSVGLLRFFNLYTFPVLGSSLAMHLSPHWGLSDPSGVQSSLSFCLLVSLSGRTRLFLAIIHAAHNCAQRMWPQATGSNPLSGSIICPSVRPSVRPSVCPSVRLSVRLRTFCNFCICINFRCGGPALRCFPPHWGLSDPSEVQSSLYVRLYASLSGRPRRFLAIIHAAHNCVQSMRPQATGGKYPER